MERVERDALGRVSSNWQRKRNAAEQSRSSAVHVVQEIDDVEQVGNRRLMAIGNSLFWDHPGPLNLLCLDQVCDGIGIGI